MKFCGECGTPLLVAVGIAPAPAIAERRLVSVLFIDLVGFTAAFAGRDAEETREFLSGYFETREARTLMRRRANFWALPASRTGDGASMLIPVPKSDCLQAREAASARLDGELSELEAARVDAHLRECAACSAYALELSAIAESLRRADLEQPQLDLTLPRRRALPGIRVAAAAAAVVAVGAGSAFALGHGLGAGSGPAATIQASAPDLAGLRADIESQHLFAMLRDTQPAHGVVQVGRVIYA